MTEYYYLLCREHFHIHVMYSLSYQYVPQKAVFLRILTFYKYTISTSKYYKSNKDYRKTIKREVKYCLINL